MRILWSLVLSLPIVACAAEAGPDSFPSVDALETHAAASAPDDGTPQHLACTSTFGSGLTSGSNGRLDGYLVSMVASGTHQCHGGNSHLHLQVRMSGQTYDVALNVNDVKFAEVDAPLVDGAWAEGWHANTSLDYAHDLGAHSSQFTSVSQSQLQRQLMDEMANANHVSVFATKYSRGGIHLVHRSRSGRPLDGAVVLYPTTGAPHYLLFQFPDQSF